MILILVCHLVVFTDTHTFLSFSLANETDDLTSIGGVDDRYISSRIESATVCYVVNLVYNFGILENYPGLWYFQYPIDSLGARSSSISVGDRA